ncbi:MAG: RnfABCDGE type electron transport complex subunit D [Planctomycetota bacterium]
MTNEYLVSPSPHLQAGEDIPAIMRGVSLALAPAFLWALYRFGYWAIVVTGLSVLSAVLTEALCQRLRGVPVTVDDWSAVVTGLLLAAVIPPNVPWHVPVLGAAFAVGVAKQCFGGLGANIWNPALLGRAFLQASFGAQINSGVWPMTRAESVWGAVSTSLRGSFQALSERAADVVTRATPLEELKRIVEPAVDAMGGPTAVLSAPVLPPAAGPWVQQGAVCVTWSRWLDAFLGNVPGSIGEVSALALLLGGLYLLARKIVSWETPVAFLGTAALLGWMLPARYLAASGATAHTGWFAGPGLYHVVTGGAMIGAFFMATDMVTTPIQRRGQLVFGAGCGLLTVLIRLYGGYPEGVCYSILLMNTLVPLIDRYTRARVFGVKKGGARP